MRRHMAAMPRHDPLPRKAEASELAWSRYEHMMKWMGLESAIAAALMGLVFLSDRTGYDDAASGQEEKK